MTLPPLPAVRVAVPGDGFENAVRAAGRRRLRSLGGTACGVTAAVLLLLAAPGPRGGTAGLDVAGDPPAPSGRPAAAAPAGPHGDPPGPAARDTAAPDDPVASTASPTPAPAPSATAPPTPPATAAPPGVPWTRADTAADPAALATCVDTADDPSAEGTRYGDWCLLATAKTEGPDKYTFRMAACAATPTAADLSFTGGRELDFDLVTGADGARVWSSATGRAFPAETVRVKADYGRCTTWWLLWNRVGDDGRRVGHATYTLRVTLRLADARPRDSVKLALS